MKAYQKILISIIVCLVAYRYFVTLSLSSEGIYQRSPDQHRLASVTEHDVQYFWGGSHRYSIFTIEKPNGEPFKKLKYEHGGKYHNWYFEGKINWRSNSKIEFNLKEKTILSLNLDD